MTPSIGSVVILGGGPAGLWAALGILKRNPGIGVTVIEREEVPGGIASSFEEEGLVWDMGSHRLHPSASAGILDDVRGLLGDDLLTVRRNGRILLGGRFVGFPLKPMEMILRLPLSFKLGVAADVLTSPFRRPSGHDTTFRGILEKGLGRTICRRFYFPYAEKLWGLPLDRLDGEQARRRVSAGTLGRMFRKLLGSSSKQSAGRYFHYPRGGFGRIFSRAAEEIQRLGGSVLLGSRVTGVTAPAEGHRGRVNFSSGGRGSETAADLILSTLPVTVLTELMDPPPPEGIRNAAKELSYRSMVLLFLKLKGRRYTGYDAHYFPGADTGFSRISERRNYEGDVPEGSFTGLCLEVPCWKSSPEWEMDPGTLMDGLVPQMVRTGLPEPSVTACFSRRIEFAYPSYSLGWERHYGALDGWIDTLPGLISLGRQGLFAHDNVHHAMEMGTVAASCVDPGSGWDSESWSAARDRFRSNRVED